MWTGNTRLQTHVKSLSFEDSKKILKSKKETDISISLVDRAGHMVVIGTTRVGKTRFADLLIGQDIRRGDVVIVLVPKAMPIY